MAQEHDKAFKDIYYKMSQDNNKLTIFWNIISLFIMVSALAYACCRAFTLSIVHDEAVTIMYHAIHKYSDIINYNGMYLDNNHLLNTILIKIFLSIFGMQEGVARIPALIGFLLYLIGVYKLSKLFFRGYFFIIGILLLCWHPFLIDYFSVARGYSLGLGFMMIGLFYLIEFFNVELINKANFYKLYWSMGFFALATLSNLSFVNVFLAVVSIIFLCGIKDLIGASKCNRAVFCHFLRLYIFPILFNAAFLAYFLMKPVIKMLKLKALNFGGTSGFWEDTVDSLIESTIYGITSIHRARMLFFYLLIISTISISAFYLTYKFIYKKYKKPDLYLLINLSIILLIYIGVVLQHVIFGTKFIVQRTAIYLIPLFLICFILLYQNIYDARDDKYFKIAINIIFSLCSIIIYINYYFGLDYYYTKEWRYDGNSKKIINYVIRLQKSAGNHYIRFRASWAFEPSFNFYRAKYHLDWLPPFQRGKVEADADYYYLLKDDKDLINKYHLRVIKYFPGSETYLAVNPDRVYPIKPACN